MTGVRRTAALFCALVATATGALLLGAAPASAHPLGNFTVNLYTGLRVGPQQVRLDHVVDLAEIPAFQARQQVDADDNGTVSSDESSTWRAHECARRATSIRVSGDGRPLRLRLESSRLTFPPGVGGLSTLRLECGYVATLAGARSLDVHDGEDPARIGWHEITAVGDGATLRSSDVPSASRSRRLTTYPKDLLTSPLDQRDATIRFTAGGAAAGAVEARPTTGNRTVDAATRAYVGLLDRAHVTPLFVLGALLLALLLGGLHALAPGHGKTLMAGYLLGAGGRVRDALTIAGTVTVTHTAGVLVLGTAVAGSYATAPERVYPWLSLAGGLLAVLVGAGLVRRASAGHTHSHGPHGHAHPPHGQGHAHPPHGHGHDHPHPHGHDHGAVALAVRPEVGVEESSGEPALRPSRRSLVSLGLAGGMIPSPSALLVLLAGIALHRTWLAVVLVVAYGAGMALALCGAGLLVLRARAVSVRVPRLRANRLVRRLPVLAGAGVALLGVQLAVRAVIALT